MCFLSRSPDCTELWLVLCKHYLHFACCVSALSRCHHLRSPQLTVLSLLSPDLQEVPELGLGPGQGQAGHQGAFLSIHNSVIQLWHAQTLITASQLLPERGNMMKGYDEDWNQTCRWYGQAFDLHCELIHAYNNAHNCISAAKETKAKG